MMTEEEKWEAAKAVIASNIANPRSVTSDTTIIQYEGESWQMARISKDVQLIPKWATRGWWLCDTDDLDNPESSIAELASAWQHEAENVLYLGWDLSCDNKVRDRSWKYDLLVFGKA